MTNEKLHARAMRQFAKDEDEEALARREARMDIDFRAGNSWNPAILASRIADGKPVLNFNKTHIFIASVSNEVRQNKPMPKVNPIGGGATKDTANVLNGILRHVQYRSQADVAYDTALDHAAGSSFGFVRATTEFADPLSMDQEIRILPVFDPFSVYGVLMPAARGQRCRHAFVAETLSKEEYEIEYGDPDEVTNWNGGDWLNCGTWLQGDDVRICEYWYEDTEKKTLRLVLAPDGSTHPIYTDDVDYKRAERELKFVPDPATGAPMEREVTITKVKFCKMDGTRVIPGTETDWVGDSIPIDAVLGQQLVVHGVVHLFSLIRFIRDAQCLINVYKSEIALKIGLSNKVPYVGYIGQFTDPKWLDANSKNYPFLEAEMVTLPNGAVAPLPQRQQLEEQINALSVAAAQEVEDLKSGMGIYDASLGARGNETSGIGIARRQQQASVTNFHFGDNLQRAEWSFASKLLKVIPKIYDKPGRQVRIVGEDQQHSVVVVNQRYQDEQGKEHHYALDVGEYDVVVTTGPSYATARQEGADTLGELFKAVPGMVQLLGDLYVGSLDYTWAEEGARRLKLAAPQNIVNEDDANAAQKIPPQVQQQIQQLQQKLEQTTQFAQSLHEQIASKQPELDNRLKIAQMQEDTKRTIALATLNSTEGLAVLEQELKIVHNKVAAMQAASTQAAQQQHDAGMQGAAQDHAAGMQSSAQDASATAQASDQSHQVSQQQSAQDATAAQQLPEAA